MDEILMTPDVAMRFLVWTAYYEEVVPEKGKSFARYLSDEKRAAFVRRVGVVRLDRLQEALFKCFEPVSVERSVYQLNLARVRGEQCPFSRESLENVFLKV